MQWNVYKKAWCTCKVVVLPVLSNCQFWRSSCRRQSNILNSLFVFASTRNAVIFKSKSFKAKDVYMLRSSFLLGLSSFSHCFRLIMIHYHSQKQRKIEFKPRMKLNPNTYNNLTDHSVYNFICIIISYSSQDLLTAVLNSSGNKIFLPLYSLL